MGLMLLTLLKATTKAKEQLDEAEELINDIGELITLLNNEEIQY